MDHVKFRAMKDGDKEDYAFLNEHEIEYTKGTSNKLLGALTELDEGLSGYKITRLGHSLQSATRAERDGVDTDWIVSTLLHDIGDIFAPYNHDEYAASILRPFVREQCTWVVEKHADFQMVYYGRHVGADPNKREKHRGHIFFDDCVTFCERWDQSSFDPEYDTLPISHFTERVHKVFARRPYDPTVLRPGVREQLVSESKFWDQDLWKTNNSTTQNFAIQLIGSRRLEQVLLSIIASSKIWQKLLNSFETRGFSLTR